MDDYSKTGLKTPKGASREREQVNRRIVRQLLDMEDEADFIEELRNRRITPNLPAYTAALNAWREKHRAR